ncbi:hypothetical protein OG767_14205 [Micromonospora sp. NBC_01392]|uniref:hypothetical protein n=1 Tax=Micromonospora sp. NBC_01392 TaxID=2903588 RepID=UPI0032492D5B
MSAAFRPESPDQGVPGAVGEAAIGMVRHAGLPLGLGAELAGFASEVVDLVAAAGTAPEDPAAHPDEELSVRWAAWTLPGCPPSASAGSKAGTTRGWPGSSR